MECSGLDASAFRALAAALAEHLSAGDVVVLSGEVGSGKTTFVRQACRSLGVAQRVTSPTYQLARGYEGVVDGRRTQVNHLDLYRLEGIEDRDALELDDYLDPGAVTFVEWASPSALGLLRDPTVVRIYHETPTTRRVTVEGPLADRAAREGPPRC